MPTRTNVPPPPPRLPRYGLVASVGGEAAIRQFMQANPSDDGPDRWEIGFEFTPENCSGNGGGVAPCGTTLFTPQSLPNKQQYDPILIWEGVKCSVIQNNPEDLRRRVSNKLLQTTSFRTERELWRGDVAQAAGLPNRYLAGPGVTDVTPVSGDAPLVYALGLIQNALADCGAGSPGMIHVTPMTATLLLAAYAIERENGVLVDAMGNTVVVGSGYDGSSPVSLGQTIDPTGDTAWMYATTSVNVRLSDVSIVDPDGSRVDRTNNVDQFIATRMSAATWDDCCHLAINVNLCETCCSPTGS